VAYHGSRRSVTSVQNTLVMHAFATPIVFAALSFGLLFTLPLHHPTETALAFLAFVVFMDAFLIAPFFEKSFVMFSSILGTWIPFALIFLSTLLTGLYLGGRPKLPFP